MRVLILTFLLLGCSPKIINIETYKITIISNKKLLNTNTVLNGKNQTLYFTFSQTHKSFLKPKLYIIGPINYTISDIHKNVTTTTLLYANTSYKIETSFKTVGDATMLFVWESKHITTKPIIINLRYYGR